MIETLTFIAIFGSGLIGGVFFIFSNTVMKALGKLPENQGIAAMNSINVTIINRWFFLVFVGTALVCLLEAILLLSGEMGASQIYTLLACGSYLFGCILVTGAINVPLNNKLVSTDPETSSGKAFWSQYLSRWTCWNSVRTFASLSATALFIKGLIEGFLGD